MCKKTNRWKYLRHCRHCGEIFKTSWTFGKVCEACQLARKDNAKNATREITPLQYIMNQKAKEGSNDKPS